MDRPSPLYAITVSILFADIVGFSKKSIEEQLTTIDEMEDVLRHCEVIKNSNTEDELIYLSTGDGFIAAFRNRLTGPIELALQLPASFRNNTRIGLHQGPVFLRKDFSGRLNLVGDGVNVAQRVMACGNENHILASSSYYEQIQSFAQYKELFHYAGKYTVKHGVDLEIHNIFDAALGVGNTFNPAKEKPVTIVVGDRRENPPQSPGDFFAQTPSPRDLTWLPSLRLPQSSVVWNDKIVLAAMSDQDMPDQITKHHLLIVGSPYCNLMSRKVNSTAFFRFNIDSDIERKIAESEKQLQGLERKGIDLKQIRETLLDHDQWTMCLRGLGFIDPVQNQTNVGAYTGKDDDYAAISFCQHPYSREHMAVLVAGLHLPGTMAALKLLGDSEFFEDHPLGGIVKVSIPRGQWFERLARSKPSWFTAPYSIEDHLNKPLATLFAATLIDQIRSEYPCSPLSSFLSTHTKKV